MSKLIPLILVVAALAGGVLWMVSKRSDSASLAEMQVRPHFENWIEFLDPQGQFKVLVPSLPHEAKENVTDKFTNKVLPYQIFVSSKDEGTIFSINLISFPENKEEKYDEKFLEKYMNSMLTNNPENQLKNFKINNFQKAKALDFSVENQNVRVTGKAFIVDRTVYVLSSTTKLENHNPVEHDFFINSFQLLPSANEKK